MKIILATFMALSFSATMAQEISLDELHKDMELASDHFSYGRKSDNPQTFENKDGSSEKLVDLESRFFDSVSTSAAGIKKRQRLR